MKYLLSILLLFSGLHLQAGLKESIQLTTDKTVYLSGEDLLVALLTTDERQRPVEFSKTGYIELADSVNAHARIMVKLENGTGTGVLTIPDELPTGYYRLRAYTRFMLNDGPDAVIEQIVAIINSNTLHLSQLGQLPTASQPEQNLNSAQSSALSTDKLRYDSRQKGILTVANLPKDAAVYHLSIAAYLPAATLPQATRQHMEPLQTAKENFTAEYEGHIIRAKISGTISEASAISLSIPGRFPWLFTGKNTGNGVFEFITRDITGSTEIASTLSTRSDERYTLEFLSPYAPTTYRKLPEITIDSGCINDIVRRHVAIQAKPAFPTSLYHWINKGRINPFTPEWSYRLEEYTRFNTIEEVIVEYISNVRFRKVGGIRTLAVNREGPDGYTLGNTLVLLDNVPVFAHELLLNYDASLIEQIDVYRGQYVFGGQLYEGIVSFESITKDFRGFQLDNSTLISTYNGPQALFRLNEPVHSKSQGQSHLPDLRTTLLWRTGIVPDEKPTKEFSFYTSDINGTYRVHIEGLTHTGKPFSEKYDIEVK